MSLNYDHPEVTAETEPVHSLSPEPCSTHSGRDKIVIIVNPIIISTIR
jgi:hypothetical protein